MFIYSCVDASACLSNIGAFGVASAVYFVDSFFLHFRWVGLVFGAE